MRTIRTKEVDAELEVCVSLSKRLGMERSRGSFLDEVTAGMQKDGIERGPGCDAGRFSDELWVRILEKQGGLKQELENLAVMAEGHDPDGEVALYASLVVKLLEEIALAASPAGAIRAVKELAKHEDGRELSEHEINLALQGTTKQLACVLDLLEGREYPDPGSFFTRADMNDTHPSVVGQT